MYLIFFKTVYYIIVMLHFRNFYCLTIVKKSIFKFTSYMKPPFFVFQMDSFKLNLSNFCRSFEVKFCPSVIHPVCLSAALSICLFVSLSCCLFDLNFKKNDKRTILKWHIFNYSVTVHEYL